MAYFTGPLPISVLPLAVSLLRVVMLFFPCHAGNCAGPLHSCHTVVVPGGCGIIIYMGVILHPTDVARDMSSPIARSRAKRSAEKQAVAASDTSFEN